MKITREKESITLKGYMNRGTVDYIGNPATYKGIEMLIIKNGRHFGIVEKSTKLWIVTWRGSRKEAIGEATKFIDNNLDKILKRVREA